MEITIRLTEEQGEKLAYIQQHTAQDLTSLLDLAINQQYEKLQSPPANPIAIWQESGFIGCGNGESDLSTNYKAISIESESIATSPKKGFPAGGSIDKLTIDPLQIADFYPLSREEANERR